VLSLGDDVSSVVSFEKDFTEDHALKLCLLLEKGGTKLNDSKLAISKRIGRR